MRSARRIRALIVAAVLAVGAGALVLAVLPTSGKSGDFHGSPVPPLFSDAQIRIVHAPLRAAEARAHRVAKPWLDAHPVTDDKAFAAWALTALGPPPGGKVPRAELAQLKALSAHRDPAGDRAAVWLESHGKKQPWKAIRKQTRPFASAAAEAATKRATTDAFALAATLITAGKARYARPSPYVSDPSVNALNQARFAGQVRQSYPSKHAVDAGAALALLEPLDPHLVSEYDWMADEIAFSRMYAGGHYLSDLTGGAFLGTLVGDYERRRAGLG